MLLVTIAIAVNAKYICVYILICYWEKIWVRIEEWVNSIKKIMCLQHKAVESECKDKSIVIQIISSLNTVEIDE
jgi:hypothetical protein